MKKDELLAISDVGELVKLDDYDLLEGLKNAVEALNDDLSKRSSIIVRGTGKGRQQVFPLVSEVRGHRLEEADK